MKKVRTEIDPDLKEELITAYATKTFNVLAEEYNLSCSVLRRTFTEWGVETRDATKPGYGANRGRTNHFYFDEIDTEEKAYWLGFLLADGNVYKNTISMKLSGKDRTHVVKFKTALSSECSILTVPPRVHISGSQTKEAAAIFITSPYMTATLHTYGITANKSLTAKPYNVSEELRRHYFRGVIDGDGYISKNMAKPAISLVGTYAVTTEFKNYCGSITHSKATPHLVTNKNIYQLIYGGRNIVTCIVRELYKDANIYLDRKMEVAKSLFQE